MRALRVLLKPGGNVNVTDRKKENENAAEIQSYLEHIAGAKEYGFQRDQRRLQHAEGRHLGSGNANVERSGRFHEEAHCHP